MNDQTYYGPLRDEQDRRRACAVLARCFLPSARSADSERFLESLEHQNVRVLAEGDAVRAVLGFVPMSLVLGGRALACTGFAGVGVPPEERGRGHAKRAMQLALAELREAGHPAALLYASTYGLYRSVGFERAGARYLASARPEDIGVVDRELRARPLSEADEAERRAVQEAFALERPGHLLRGPHLERRARTEQGLAAEGVGFEGEDGLEGYLQWVQQPTEGGPYELFLTDWAALTPAALRRLLCFLADHRSLATRVRWPSGPHDPLLHALPERRYQLTLADLWLLRVLDPAQLLEGRGYASALCGRLDLELEDELFPQCGGRWRLEVEGGRARLQPGGEGELALGTRALAPLCTGHLRASELVRLGWARGARAALERADALFAGPAPCMPDMF